MTRISKFLLIIVSFFILTVRCTETVKKNRDINGKSIEFFKEKYGLPSSEKEFILSKSLYEYQYGLLVFYPNPDGKNIHIVECVWDKKHKRTVVWFRRIEDKWVSLDNITWNPDKVKF